MKYVLSYAGYKGDTNERNRQGAESSPERGYSNNTGRNDFCILKVVNDAAYVYFFEQTNGNITGEQGKNWMNRYIDSDRNFKTGWLGYDFRMAEGKKLLEYSNGDWKSVAPIDIQTDKDKMMYAVPLQLLKLSGPPNLEFKWSDNMQDETDPLDWYINGNVAPGGRFNFIYTSENE